MKRKIGTSILLEQRVFPLLSRAAQCGGMISMLSCSSRAYEGHLPVDIAFVRRSTKDLRMGVQDLKLPIFDFPAVVNHEGLTFLH